MARTSKPVRLKKIQLDALSAYKAPEEPWSVAIEALLKEAKGASVWTLPGATFKTKKEATQLALELGVQAGLEYEQIEQPIKVKRV